MPLTNPMNATSYYYKPKEKAFPFGPSRMPTQRLIPLFSSILPKEHLVLSTQFRYPTSTCRSQIKAPCHLPKIDKTATD